MLVCEINVFLKSDKHVLCCLGPIYDVTFMSKILFDYQGTKSCSVIEMYS